MAFSTAYMDWATTYISIKLATVTKFGIQPDPSDFHSRLRRYLGGSYMHISGILYVCMSEIFIAPDMRSE